MKLKLPFKVLRVWLVCALIVLFYESIGYIAWSIKLASSVPMLWKILTLLVMFTTIWCIFHQIDRRHLDRSLPAFDKRWFMWLVLVAYTFAIISADNRILFHVGTCSWIVFAWAEMKYYRWKKDRVRKGEVVA